jgi:hypothetical protein
MATSGYFFMAMDTDAPKGGVGVRFQFDSTIIEKRSRSRRWSTRPSAKSLLNLTTLHSFCEGRVGLSP